MRKKFFKLSSAFTLIEVLFMVAMSGILIMAISYVAGQAKQVQSVVTANKDLQRQSQFIMQRIINAVGRSQRLTLPLAENPVTTQLESVRDVLALTLDPTQDLDGDGFFDADNDRDGLVDEDWGSDNNRDDRAGIRGIDDDNDGSIDETSKEDDDERGGNDEDKLDGIDNDGDGAIDEDMHADMNLDGEPGVIGVDDDGDSSIDEGDKEDDDEDGSKDEDWYDSVVYYLVGSNLKERLPNPHAVNGQDYTESTLASNVTVFTVTRLPAIVDGQAQLVDISLQLTDSDGEQVAHTVRLRVGGEL